MRRGNDAVHTRFARRHVAAGWRGEPRRFGEGMAILVGDFAFTYADVLMRGMPDAALRRVRRAARRAVRRAIARPRGHGARRAPDAELANRIAVYKSGKYTVERPLHLGAALADGLGPLGPALSAIGLPLGHAFQLRDDVLGAFGDAEITGKPVGDDLREGKPTPLVALAFARAGAADRRAPGTPRRSRPHAPTTSLRCRASSCAPARSTRSNPISNASSPRPATRSASAPLADTARTWLDELAAYVAWRDR